MEYRDFVEALKGRLQEEIGDSTEIEEVKQIKNNGTLREGISLTSPGREEKIVFYLQDFYEKYEETGKMEEIMKEILKIQEGAETFKGMSKLYSWKDAKPRIRAYIVQKEWNQELLKQWCYKEYLDLAITFRIIIDENEDRTASCCVTWEMLDMWGIELEELWNVAKEHLYEEECTLCGMIERIFGKEYGEEYGEEDTLYVFQTVRTQKGAVAMLRRDILRKFAEKQEADIYILPSSVHEILLLKDTEEYSAKALKEMVQEINGNRCLIAEDERLSDSIYRYLRETDEIEIAA